MQDQFIMADGVRTRWRVAGQGGVPLVMLHGLSGSLEDWGDAPAALAAALTRRVITIDLLGCGQTDAPDDGVYSADLMRDHVIAVLDALDLPLVDLNGWSMGGRIAIDVAHSAPERVGKLVLTAPAGVGSDSIVNFQLPPLTLVGQVLSRPAIASARILQNTLRRDTSGDIVRFTLRRFGMISRSKTRRAFLGQLRTFMGATGFLPGPRADLLATLPRITVPVCAIWGDRDMFVPPDHADILTRTMPRCRLVMLARCGHVPQLEQPAAYVQSVVDFLSESPAN